MKTSEFIKKIESLGYEVQHRYGNIYIGHDGHTAIEVREYMFGSIDTNWSGFEKLEQHEIEKIHEITFKYITTPIEEREEPKKYYLKLPKDFIGEDLYSERTYLNFYKVNNKYFFSNESEHSDFQTQFTQEEIDKLDTTHLIKEEVKEENEEEN